jgi:hypothetical protein
MLSKLTQGLNVFVKIPGAKRSLFVEHGTSRIGCVIWEAV